MRQEWIDDSLAAETGAGLPDLADTMPGEILGPEAETSRKRARRTVALVNSALLAIVVVASVALSMASDSAHDLPAVVPALLFAAWCGLVQFALRDTMTLRERWKRQLWWKNVVIAGISTLVLLFWVDWAIRTLSAAG